MRADSGGTRVLLTGGTGCIGAVTARDLLWRGVDQILVATRSAAPGLLRLWLGDAPDPRIVLLRADVADAAAMQQLVREHRPTHIVHLGALQSPDCDANPELGMRSNVGGTLALLTAAEQLGAKLQRFVFASSAAVYGPRSLYPGALVRETDPLAPPNLYGIWKLAGEHLARLFQQRSGVPTVCLRLNTTYGKGRDRGKTSAPTTAMKCVARGSAERAAQPFRMPYQGRENYHYVEDVGAQFAAATLEPFLGFAALNIQGQTIEVAEFLATVQRVATGLGMGEHLDLGIAADAAPNLFVSDLDDSAITQRFPRVPRTPIEAGIRRSLLEFQRLAASRQL